MWVVTGPFDGKESDELQPASSKLLKAGKTYTIGRKDQSLVIRHKKISREHARIGVDLCSEQDVANPKSAPPLWIEIIRSDKKKEVARHLIRVGQELPISLNAGERFQLQDGDSIEMVTGVPISLKWQQVCCYWSPKDDPSISLQTCASLGIHVVPTLRHEVTHHLASALTLSPELATSMISVAVIVKPEWLAEVIRLGESADDAPSQLEREFKPPHVSKYRPTFSPFLPSPVKSTSRWEPNEARVGLFRGYRFMFVGEKGRETQDAMKELVKRAEGDYECVAVEGGRSAWHKALAKGKSKGKALVLVADEGSMKIAIGQDRWQEFVDEAKSFELRFVNRAKVIEAVIHIDIQFIDSSLKGGDADTQSGSPLPDVVQNTHPDEPSIPPQTQEPTPALASEAPPPRRPLVRRLPSRAPSRAPSLPPDTASATTVEGAQPQDPDAPKPRRQLVRRLVKPKTTIIGVDDPSVELDGEPALQPSTSSTVQKEDAPQVSNNDAPEPSRAPRRLLKRRLGPNGPLASQVPPPSEDTLAAEPEEPPLKKFKALFEESDPARVAQSGMQSGISTGQTADAGESITQSESGTTQVHPRLRAGGRTQLAALAEEEEESMSGATPDLNVLQPNQSQGLKRKTPMEEDEDVEMVDEEGPRPKRRAVEDVNAVQSSAFGAVGKPPSQATAKPSSRADQTQKSQKPSGAAPGKPDMDEAFLKAVATTKRGKRAEDTFDREFNNLRISKPDLDRDEQQKEWAVLDDFGDDGDMRGNFMVIVEMDVHRKDGEQRALRAGGGRTDWEGRPDFKKFKKKAPAGSRRAVELYAEDADDYGVGPQYWKGSSQLPSQAKADSKLQSHLDSSEITHTQRQKPRSGTPHTRHTQAADLDNYDDSMDDSQPVEKPKTQSRAPSSQPSRARTRQTQGRGKKLPLFIESDDDVEKDASPPQDEDEFIDDIQSGSDHDLTLRSTTRTQRPSQRKSTRAAATREQAPPVLVDDDSDDGATFKGFGARKTRRT